MRRKSASRAVRQYLGGEVRRTVLPNGLRVVTERMPHSHTFSVGFFVGVGSVDETDRSNGSSHFLEHVLFKGTRRRAPEEISAAIESVGGELNAYTAKEHTCFYARVLAENADLAIDVLSDMITSSVIRTPDVQAERAVILDEIAMHGDDPVESVQEMVSEQLLPHPGLGLPVIGTEESITALSRQQIVRHWRRNYHPGSLVVAAAGQVDHDHLVAQLAEIGDFGGPDIRRRPRRAGSGGSGSRLVADRRPFEQSTVSLAYPGPGIFEAERFPLGLLSVILGGGMSSRLFVEVRERRGLAYGIEAGETSYTDHGLWSVDWQSAPDKVEEILHLVRHELAEIAENGVTDEELDRAKGQMRGQTVLSYEGPQSRMSRLGTAELIGDPRTVLQLLDEYDRITSDDIGKTAADLLGRPAVLALVGPRRPTKRLEKLIS
ncbi:pitrilysin family protein [Microlunatus sp. Gsoil 973]|uniref:M16 family metallopeptidase n=1 Tax=Microlunatus sp. Gsoil 973 TaxID=2672569 RepID=UPI0012B4E3CD|nr:pitrilysin family protein [Microlunatus sp. Gsoil 973]QGN32047.1 insulinase family protein [Microlunatus sp. Gsoil 973]